MLRGYTLSYCCFSSCFSAWKCWYITILPHPWDSSFAHPIESFLWGHPYGILPKGRDDAGGICCFRRRSFRVSLCNVYGIRGCHLLRWLFPTVGGRARIFIARWTHKMLSAVLALTKSSRGCCLISSKAVTELRSSLCNDSCSQYGWPPKFTIILKLWNTP